MPLDLVAALVAVYLLGGVTGYATCAVFNNRTTAADVDPPAPTPPPLPLAPRDGNDHQCHYTRLARETLNGVPRTLKHCSGCGERFWEDD